LNHTTDTSTTFNLVYMARQHPGMYAFTASTSEAPGPVNRTYLYYEPVTLTSQDFVSAVNENPQYMAGSTLAQNYPNPFVASQGGTNVVYQIPAGQSGTLKVYDELGREVSSMNLGISNGSQQQFHYSASNLPAGVYRYVISTRNGVNLSREMVLMQ
jgi:hypothetical protein